MANCLDWCVGAEFLAQSADADVDDVRPRVEVIPPDLRQQAFTADDLARMLSEVMEDAKLAIGQLRRQGADARLTPREIEHERPGAEDVAVVSLTCLS